MPREVPRACRLAEHELDHRQAALHLPEFNVPAEHLAAESNAPGRTATTPSSRRTERRSCTRARRDGVTASTESNAVRKSGARRPFGARRARWARYRSVEEATWREMRHGHPVVSRVPVRERTRSRRCAIDVRARASAPPRGGTGAGSESRRPMSATPSARRHPRVLARS